ncbi:MAG: hypothetical protein AAGJ08_12540 [Cyanobacteria bacterium P01_H01_bin.35]
MWFDPYERLGLRCNPFLAEQTPGVTDDLWIDRGFSQPPLPRKRSLIQLIGQPGAGKTSHLMHWHKQTRGSYISYSPSCERWQIPPVEAIAYWDEADPIPIPYIPHFKT